MLVQALSEVCRLKKKKTFYSIVWNNGSYHLSVTQWKWQQWPTCGEIMLKGEEMLFHLQQDEVWWYAGSTRLDCCSSLWLKVVEVKYGARCDSLEGPSGCLFNSYILWWWRSLHNSRSCWLANLGCCSCSWLRLIDPFSSEKLSFFFCDHFIIWMSPLWSFALDVFFSLKTARQMKFDPF